MRDPSVVEPGEADQKDADSPVPEARGTVATARSLYGNAAAKAVTTVFQNRGILP